MALHSKLFVSSLLTLYVFACNGFVLSPVLPRSKSVDLLRPLAFQRLHHQGRRFRAASDDEATSSRPSVETEEMEAEVAIDEKSEEAEELDTSAAMSEAEPVENPELKALKDEIAELENTLKQKRRTLASTVDAADEYTSAGYARKVAEMENMRRARSSMNSINRSGATAAVLTNFLPILDQLDNLHQEYGANEFGKQYNALPGAIQTAFTQLGVSDFAVQAGDRVDKLRMDVVEEEHSEDVAIDSVLRSLTGGLELQGNVIRAAQVVASLGSESAEEEERGEVADEDEANADLSADENENSSAE